MNTAIHITWADLARIKKAAKAAETHPDLTHMQRLDALAASEFGVRHFHELQNAMNSKWQRTWKCVEARISAATAISHSATSTRLIESSTWICISALKRLRASWVFTPLGTRNAKTSSGQGSSS